jgi:hypothetical protein
MNFSNRARSHNAILLSVLKLRRLLHENHQNHIIVYPFIVTIDTIQSSSGAPLRLPRRVGIHCLQLRCVVDLHCIPVEIFPNARRHCRLYRPPWISHRITNRLQRCLHKICYRQGKLIFYIQFKSVCSPYRSQILRLHHCRLLFFRTYPTPHTYCAHVSRAYSAHVSCAFFRAPHIMIHAPTNRDVTAYTNQHHAYLR